MKEHPGMKILCFLACLLPLTLSAQQTRPFTVGWLVGIQQSGPVTKLDTAIFGQNLAEQRTQRDKVVGMAGIRMEALLGGNATLRLDVMYADRGYREDVRFSQSGGPLQKRVDRYRFGYLSLPFTARIPLHSGEAFLYATGGVVADRLLFVSARGTSVDEAEFVPWAFSWTAGLGASYPFSGESRGCFEIGTIRGFSEYRIGSSWQPRSFGLTLGWVY